MKTGDLIIRCLAMKEGEQWVAICLPFDLAAQADTLPEVRAKLREQIHAYLNDALAGQDQEHAPYLLRRRAPLRYWAAYWLAGLVRRARGVGVRRINTIVPMVPAPC